MILKLWVSYQNLLMDIFTLHGAWFLSPSLIWGSTPWLRNAIVVNVLLSWKCLVLSLTFFKIFFWPCTTWDLSSLPVCVLNRLSRAMTLQTVADQAPLSMGFSRQEYWRRLPCPPPRDLPYPGTEPVSPTLQEDSFNCWATRETLSSLTRDLTCDPAVEVWSPNPGPPGNSLFKIFL